MDSLDTTYDCEAELVMKDETAVELGKPRYSGALTPTLTSMNPRYGSVVGGESVTFSGSGFASTAADNEIIIDGIPCVPTAASSSSVTCTLGKRRGLPARMLTINVKDRGFAATQGKLFDYVQRWSDDSTWAGEFAPMLGETVAIQKGVSLLFDVDSTEVLNAVLVEGALIFPSDADPAHHRRFDAHYIFVRGPESKLEAGTEEDPYTSRLTITMHSKIEDPYIPIYGNKCIGLRQGTLDLHGVKRSTTWTVLEKTAEAGTNQITLSESVDWVVGDVIGVASTSYQGREAEKKSIVSIDRTDATKPVLTLDSPFEFKHFAEIY
jgi:hypothetical protein